MSHCGPSSPARGSCTPPPLLLYPHVVPAERAECNKDVVFPPFRTCTFSPLLLLLLLIPLRLFNHLIVCSQRRAAAAALFIFHGSFLSRARPVAVDWDCSVSGDTQCVSLHLNSSVQPSQPPERKSDFSG